MLSFIGVDRKVISRFMIFVTFLVLWIFLFFILSRVMLNIVVFIIIWELFLACTELIIWRYRVMLFIILSD